MTLEGDPLIHGPKLEDDPFLKMLDESQKAYYEENDRFPIAQYEKDLEGIIYHQAMETHKLRQ